MCRGILAPPSIMPIMRLCIIPIIPEPIISEPVMPIPMPGVIPRAKSRVDPNRETTTAKMNHASPDHPISLCASVFFDRHAFGRENCACEHGQ
jgi:hypothetical protein